MRFNEYRGEEDELIRSGVEQEKYYHDGCGFAVHKMRYDGGCLKVCGFANRWNCYKASNGVTLYKAESGMPCKWFPEDRILALAVTPPLNGEVSLAMSEDEFYDIVSAINEMVERIGGDCFGKYKVKNDNDIGGEQMRKEQMDVLLRIAGEKLAEEMDKETEDIIKRQESAALNIGRLLGDRKRYCHPR